MLNNDKGFGLQNEQKMPKMGELVKTEAKKSFWPSKRAKKA